MPFLSYDGIIDAITHGQGYDISWFKTGVAAEAAGQWETLWRRAGSPGAGGTPAVAPGTKYVGTAAAPVAGAICFPDLPSATKHLLTVFATASQNMVLMVYDRLYAVSGISVATTGDRALDTSGAVGIARYTDGYGVLPVLEVTTATTTTAPVVNLKLYTNQLGQQVGPGPNFTFPAVATDADCMMFLPLLGTDIGCRDIRTLNVVTAGAAGICTVALIKPLAYLPLVANIGNERDLVLQLAALPQIFDGACLGFAFMASVATLPTMFGQIRVAYA